MTENKTDNERTQQLAQIRAQLQPGVYTPVALSNLLEQIQQFTDDTDLYLALTQELTDAAETFFDLQHEITQKTAEKNRSESAQFYSESAFAGEEPELRELCLPELFEMSQEVRKGTTSSQELLQYFETLPVNEVSEKYWSVHNPEYRSRLSTLTEQISPEGQKKIHDAKLVVVVAAMNETELDLMYQALAQNYNSAEQFENEVHIILYHNFKGDKTTLDKDVTDSVDSLKTKPNVSVIEEQVGSDVNVVSDGAKAKKVAVDCLLSTLSPDESKNLLFIDADLRKIAPTEVLKSAQNQLSISEGKLALSSQYNYDSRVDQSFPALAKYFQIEEFISNQAVAKNEYQSFVVGGFTFMNSKTFMSVGGWPLRHPEDTHFTFKLNTVFPESHSVSNLASNVRVEMDNGREIASIIENQAPESRWAGQNNAAYMQLSGSKRLDWQNVTEEQIQNVPLLHEKDTTKSMLVALNAQYLDFLNTRQLKKGSPEVAKAKIEKRILDLLMYLKTQGVIKVTMEGLAANTNSENQELSVKEIVIEDNQQLPFDVNQWRLSKFTDLEFKEEELPD